MRTQFTLSPEQVEAFWSRVDRSGGPDACWPWTGHRSRHGYGVFHLRGQGHPRANRIAWFLANGPIPEGRVVAHVTCDDPPCCNPAHLDALTQLENIADRDRKGRQDHGPNAPKWSPPPKRGHRRGEGAARAKLTTEKVREIRRRYAEGGVSQDALAAAYGVAPYAIFMVVHRRSWAHVE